SPAGDKVRMAGLPDLLNEQRIAREPQDNFFRGRSVLELQLLQTPPDRGNNPRIAAHRQDLVPGLGLSAHKASIRFLAGALGAIPGSREESNPGPVHMKADISPNPRILHICGGKCQLIMASYVLRDLSVKAIEVVNRRPVNLSS